jgi:hypothetical protein
MKDRVISANEESVLNAGGYIFRVKTNIFHQVGKFKVTAPSGNPMNIICSGSFGSITKWVQIAENR